MRGLVFPACLAVVACSGAGNLPSAEDIERGREKVVLAVDLADRARTALEMLGLLPTYECGEPRRTFVGRAVVEFELEHPCATVTTEAVGDEADRVTITFPDGGCEALGSTLEGPAHFVYSGGTDRFSLDADLSGLEVEGNPLGTSAGYGTCGDESSYWARGEGSVPGSSGLTFALDVTVALRDGIPVIGSGTVILDGSAELGSPDGTDRVSLVELEYETGALLPGSGLLVIETASGTRIQARFSSGSLFHDEVEITIDDYDPVTVPLFG